MYCDNYCIGPCLIFVKSWIWILNLVRITISQRRCKTNNSYFKGDNPEITVGDNEWFILFEVVASYFCSPDMYYSCVVFRTACTSRVTQMHYLVESLFYRDR